MRSRARARRPDVDERYDTTGNVLFDRMFWASLDDLPAGTEGANSGIDVLGISVRQPDGKLQEAAVHKLVQVTAEKLGIKGGIDPDRVKANGDYVGEGYGIPAEDTIEAIDLLARHEGILLDPVYSAKGMAGLIDQIRKGAFDKNDNIVFLHTGGATALFAYENQVVVEWSVHLIRFRPSGPGVTVCAQVFGGREGALVMTTHWSCSTEERKSSQRKVPTGAPKPGRIPSTQATTA